MATETDTKLTFNLSAIKKENLFGLDTTKLSKLQEEGKTIKYNTWPKILMSSWSTTSTDIRYFLEKVFGINFSIDCDHYSYHRSKLNELIKKVKKGNTQRRKRTKLNFFEYSDLIQSKEFIKFVTDKYNRKIDNQKRMHEELNYLYLNKYRESDVYQEDKEKILQDTADVLSMMPHLADQIKDCYCMYFDVKTIESMNQKIELNQTQKYIMDIVKYRFNQTGLSTYKYSSPEDVMSANNTQIIRHFLIDISRSYFEITNSKYG